jgi:hypothetical protein
LQRSHLPKNVTFTPPLSVLADMPSVWTTSDSGFDDAAELFVTRHREDGAIRDIPLADIRTWAVTARGENLALQPIGRRQEPLALRAGGLCSLCSRLQVPAEFVRRLPAALQLAVLNWGLAHLPRAAPVMLRTRGGAVTTIVSERYAALEAHELVDTLRRALTAHGLLGSVRVRAVVTGMTDALRLTLPERTVEPAVGDVTQAGLDVSTSSFARGAVRVRGTLYRLVCTNGLSAPERMGDYSARHIGDGQRLREFLQDAIPSALTHTSGLMSAWQRALTSHIEDLAEAIASIRDLTGPERQVIEEAITHEAGAPELPPRSTVYNVVNGITAAAHRYEPSRRLELEGLAGRLLMSHAGAS